MQKILTNNQIKAQQVRVIDPDGNNLGIFSLSQALKLAQEKGLDLVLVTEKANPPICRIVEYGKFLYQQQKKGKGKKHKGLEVKGIRLRFNISPHDLEIRAKTAEKFLRKGHKVKIELLLYGREQALQAYAKSRIDLFLEMLQKLIPIKIESQLKKEGRNLVMVITKDKG